MLPWNYWLVPTMPWLFAARLPAMMWMSALAAWAPPAPASAEIIQFPISRMRRRA